MKKTVLVNLFAGPGTGKSTTMAGLFSELKWRGIDCEMVTEYAKRVVWKNNINSLHNQIYVFAKQQDMMFHLNGQVDVMITDSPLLLSLIYAKDKTEIFEKYVLEEFDKFNNFNVLLQREKIYNPNGRLQTYEEAVQKDTEIVNLLNKYNKTAHVAMLANRENMMKLANAVERQVRN